MTAIGRAALDVGVILGIGYLINAHLKHTYKTAENMKNRAAVYEEAQRQLQVAREKTQRQQEFTSRKAQKQHDWQDKKDQQHTYLYETFDILKEVDSRIIYSGCVYPLTGLTKEQQDFINQSKAATGNTICDASLATKHFDMKAQPSPTNNYIVLWNYESFDTYGEVIKTQNALYSFISKIPVDSCTIFQKELFILLNDLKEAPLDTLQKQMIINTFAIKALHKMTLADRIFIIFPVTTSPFKPNPVYDEAVKKIEIPIKRSAIDSAETKKAIMGVVNTWDKSKQDKFAEVTFTQSEDDI